MQTSAVGMPEVLLCVADHTNSRDGGPDEAAERLNAPLTLVSQAHPSRPDRTQWEKLKT